MSNNIQERPFTDVFVTAANEVWGKVMFLQLSVILFTGLGGGCIPACTWAGDMYPSMHLGREGVYPNMHLGRRFLWAGGV